jgi:hypothetical protein
MLAILAMFFQNHVCIRGIHILEPFVGVRVDTCENRDDHVRMEGIYVLRWYVSGLGTVRPLIFADKAFNFCFLYPTLTERENMCRCRVCTEFLEARDSVGRKNRTGAWPTIITVGQLITWLLVDGQSGYLVN